MVKLTNFEELKRKAITKIVNTPTNKLKKQIPSFNSEFKRIARSELKERAIRERSTLGIID